MSHKFSKLLALVIVLISSINSYAQSQDYPKVLDNFIYPLGYDRNIFDTPFSDFEKYVNSNYKCEKGHSTFPGFKNARISTEILGIKFNLLNGIFFETTCGSLITYKNYSYHSKSEHDKFVNDLVNSGLKKISQETYTARNGNSATHTELRYKNIFEININYLIDNGGGIEFSCKKLSNDLATGFPKVKPASTASASSTKSNSNNLQDILIGKWIILDKNEYDAYKKSGHLPQSFLDNYRFDNNGKCQYHYLNQYYDEDYDEDREIEHENLRWKTEGDSKLILYTENGRIWSKLNIQNFTNNEIHYSQKSTTVIFGTIISSNEDYVLIKQ